MSTATWTKLARYPGDLAYCSHVIHCLKEDILTLEGGDDILAKQSRICAFDLTQNRWTYDKYQNASQQIIGFCSSGLDKKNDILYILDEESSVFKVDLKNNTFQQFDKTNNKRGYGLIINQQFHVFNENHMIWNGKKQLFFKQSTTDDMPNGSGIVYIPSKSTVLIIGGATPNRFLPEARDSIYSYNIRNNEWKELNLIFPIKAFDFGCVMTKDQRYIITFGGVTNEYEPIAGMYASSTNKKSNDIYVLDIHLMKFEKSKVKCPKGSMYIAIIPDYNILRDEYSVFGYIKNLWKQKQFDNMQCLPQYMIYLLAKFYVNDYVHLIDTHHWHNNDHYQIKVDSILDFE